MERTGELGASGHAIYLGNAGRAREVIGAAVALETNAGGRGEAGVQRRA